MLGLPCDPHRHAQHLHDDHHQVILALLFAISSLLTVTTVSVTITNIIAARYRGVGFGRSTVRAVEGQQRLNAAFSR